jgi:hypothetical protein
LRVVRKKEKAGIGRRHSGEIEMQPLDRTANRDSASPERLGERRSADIISLDDWRRRHGRPVSRWRWIRPTRLSIVPEREYKVPIEAWLMALIVFSAIAGAIFALMALGYLP